jgi:alpha-L-glutamate ligase-like protein
MMFRKLSQLGVLGMNARIGSYMLPYNKRDDYPKVDDKVLTAQLAEALGMPMPENYAVFETFGSLKHLPEALSPHPAFVIKPSRGALGNGIIVISETRDGMFIRADGKHEDMQSIRYHISHILSGFYSINGYPDRAIVQYKISTHRALQPLSAGGVPDIRIIVYRGFPVMAMMRIPTKKSQGRANLHQGGIGVGINITTGKTTGGVDGTRIVHTHPDSGLELCDIPIPHWEKILHLAVMGFELSRLEYLGADIALDDKKGPLLLELNARPGLSIQLANMIGLRQRLSLFKDIPIPGLSPKERIKKALEIIPRFE